METIEFNRLLRHLAEVKTPLSVARLYDLSDLDDEQVAWFRSNWSTIPAERRRQIVGFLLDIAESSFEVDFEPVFCACIDDADEEVRARSVAGLWESEDEGLIAPFLDMVQNEPSVQARAAAASALGSFVLLGELNRISAQNKMAIEEALLALVRSPQESLKVRRRAVEALAYSDRKEVPGVIENAYYHTERQMRVAAVFAMGRSLDPQWESLLLDELHSHDPELRFEAARACSELELERAIPHLAQLLTDKDREVQEAGIWALGQIGGSKARQVLEAHHEAIDPQDVALRETVEEALNELALASGAVQFPLYECGADADDEISIWADDWLDGVLGREPDAALPEDLDDL